MHRLHLMVAIVALAAGGRARAQTVGDLPSGARVRITVPDSVRQAPLIGLSIGVAANDGELGRESIGIGAVVAALGVIMGALSPYEHWHEVR